MKKYLAEMVEFPFIGAILRACVWDIFADKKK